MSKPTIEDLMKRAKVAIEEDEPVIYDVAANEGQVVNNVKHMRWFIEAVAQELGATEEVD